MSTVLAVQFDLFDTPAESELQELRRLTKDAQDTSVKVRKALFARHGEMQKRIAELEERLEIIERNICKPAQTYNLFKLE